jgi:hypothetical protein
MSDDRPLDARAWHDLCARLSRLGDEILGPEYPASPRARAEGYRHLANQVVGWLGWSIGYPDAEFPAFFRQNDQVVRWGGPNVDQVTRRARVASAGTYVITGNMGSCEDFILTVKDGDMHGQRYGILTERLASELGIAAGDDFEITLSAEQSGSCWVPLPEDAAMVNVREYYFGWEPRPPAIMTIRRLDRAGEAPAPLTAAAVAGMLEEAATTIEQSIRYWNEYVAQARTEQPVNTMGPPRHSPGGSTRIHYSFGFYALDPEETLVIDADVAGARFWDVQLYTLGWFEPFDYANRVTSLNHLQAATSPDGHARIVVAHRDPGVANWLDTEQRPEAMITVRWIDTREEPGVDATVVGLDEVDAALPADTPRISAEERRAQIRRRQEHVAWRYRT